MKTAIVHDWLVKYGGAERVLEQMLRVFPEADLYSLFDFFPKDRRDVILNKKVKTSFLQGFPNARTKYHRYLPLMPLAVEQFNLSKYDLVISSSWAVAKGVITGPDQLHVCMCYSPMRYAWDQMHMYLKASGLTGGVRGWLTRYILHKMRMWDNRTANGVDEFIAISNYIAGRINKAYRRDATLIYPPVDVEAFELREKKEDFYLTASRLVAYKNVVLIAEAFTRMPDKRLVIIGEGPHLAKIRKIAGPNITVLGYQPFEVLKDHMQRAKAFVFAAEEDFGIVPIEAQACGTPVIAYGRGGALETVVENKTGLFFYRQEQDDIIAAVREFEAGQEKYIPGAIRENALKFSTERFLREFGECMERILDEYTEGSRSTSPLRLSRNVRPTLLPDQNLSSGTDVSQ
ncbi:MAG: glycosyltransferase family 4 protein [bacterium]|nr:glycosyltransferase family 4 protein [bacterium]